MAAEHRRREYVIVLFVAAVLALNYPLLSIYNRVLLPLGIPLLYLYIFLVWLVIIVLTAMAMERPQVKTDDQAKR